MDLEKRVELLRSQPLKILCRTANGEETVMTVDDCIKSGAAYIHVVEDDLDVLLEKELNTERKFKK